MKFNILLLFFSLLATAGVHAQAALSMQGTIRNSTGAAVPDGVYSITFKLYSVETGGTPVWTETQDNIKVVGGVYSALLGASNPLTAAFNVPYYVGISVEGGSELIPRFRLTSAPYAMALIGQSNTFPSAGAVGVGTASPVSGNNLHVHNENGSAKALISSADVDDSTILTLKSGSNSGNIAIEGGNGNFNIVGDKTVNIIGNGGVRAYTYSDGMVLNGKTLASTLSSVSGQDMTIQRAEDTHIVCRGDGWTQFNKSLLIGGSKSFYFGGTSVVWSNNWAANGTPQTNATMGVSLRADQNASAANFVAYSDRRIKKDFHLSSGSRDLATLMQLEVTDYRHIDTIAKGSGEVKGFIAQQVEKVFPQAVSVDVDAIPDIFSKPAALQVNGTEATLRMPVAHQLEAGNRVRIMQDGGGQIDYDVVRTEGNAFTVKDWNTAVTEAEKVFVYGREVNDFRTVDYDKIHNLNVSATQELARQVEQLRAENAELRSKYDSMLRANEAVNGRLAKLEALLDSGASKR
jgi:hypothetical protein